MQMETDQLTLLFIQKCCIALLCTCHLYFVVLLPKCLYDDDGYDTAGSGSMCCDHCGGTGQLINKKSCIASGPTGNEYIETKIVARAKVRKSKATS